MSSYLKLFKSGELQKRAQHFNQVLSKCVVCPRHCEVNRNQNEMGFCNSGALPLVASTVAHFGEEPVLVGTKGAGNVFFGSCNLRCVYCQNYQISHTAVQKHPSASLLRRPLPATYQSSTSQSGLLSASHLGTSEQPILSKLNQEISYEELANRMITLQNQGCHNINLVSPSHFVAQFMLALVIACEKGLTIPIVYNTNAYDDLETLKLLDGVVDIYLPDLKYADDLNALKYSQAKNYQQISRSAIQEMFRQVGFLQINKDGLATRGLMIRHLILPNGLADTRESLTWIAQNISPKINISLMSQYYPTNKAERIPLLSRKIREREYWEAVEILEELEMENGFMQEFDSAETYRPDFTREAPFDNQEL